MIGGSDRQTRSRQRSRAPALRAAGGPSASLPDGRGQRRSAGLGRARRLRHQQRVHRPGHAELLQLPGPVRRGPDGGGQLQRGEPRALQDRLPEAAERRRPAATADGAAAGRPRLLHGHPRPRRHLGGRVRPGRLDPAVDRHVQAAGHRRHAEGAVADRDLARAAGGGALQQQHSAALVPLRPGEDAAGHLGADVRRRPGAGQAGQAAPHRDPGRPVRGHRRLVQHAGGQRGRQHPERDLNGGQARPARDQGAVDHEDAGQLIRRPTRRSGCRWRTRTGWPWKPARPRSS